MHLQNKFLILSILLFSAVLVHAQPEEIKFIRYRSGISAQLYPAGIISTINVDLFLNPESSILFRFGRNDADRKNFSPYNDNEKGTGTGISIGYRFHRALKKGEFIAGLHCDNWNMWIDWKNDIDKPTLTRGTTYTLVIQPWIEAGYYYSLKQSSFGMMVNLGFGREINVITEGKPVGQGWMASATLGISYTIFSNQN